MENFDYDLQSIQGARDLARRGEAAAKQMTGYTSEQIDRILQSMVKAAEEHAACLAQVMVEETGFGKVLDKAYKNHAVSTLLYNDIKEMNTVGIICGDKDEGTMDVAEPVGLIMGVVPSINPASIVIYKSMIAIKAGNAIVFLPHLSAAKCTLKAAELMGRAAKEAGTPEGVISCILVSTMGVTNELMHCKEVSIIIAANGSGMVKAVYNTGKPAIGMGAGNSPAYVGRTVDVRHAVRTVITSKTFDNGTICASEQFIICEECNHDQVVAELKAQGGYFMTKEGTEKVCSLLFKSGHSMDAKFVGRSPRMIAEKAGITIPEGAKALIGEQGSVGEGYPLSCEKLTTVLAFYTVKDWKETYKLSMDLLQNGIGHTTSLYTQGRGMTLKFAAKPASRILVNTGGSQGGTGTNAGLNVAFTLGCGTCGGSSVSENVSPMQLINIRKVAYGLKDCVTLMGDGKTSRPDAAVSMPAPVSAPKAPLACSSCEGSMSPAAIVAAYGARNHAEEHTGSPAPSGTAPVCEDEKLATLVHRLVITMENQQDVQGKGSSMDQYEAIVRLLMKATKEDALGSQANGQDNGRTDGQCPEKDDGIPVGIPNRHVHLFRGDLSDLFGAGHGPTKMKDLSQPGQYACKEAVTICGPKGAIEKVRILEPVRPRTQVETLSGDSFKLGIKAPARLSGDLDKIPGITIIGPRGSVQTKEGLIVTQRYIHMLPQDAARFGMHDRQNVSLEIDGIRGGILRSTIVRITGQSGLECHIDMEEASALGLDSSCTVKIIK